MQRPKAAETPSLKEEDFPALGGSSSRTSAWGKKPNAPKVDEVGALLYRVLGLLIVSARTAKFLCQSCLYCYSCSEGAMPWS